MAGITKEQVVDFLSKMTILEAVELTKAKRAMAFAAALSAFASPQHREHSGDGVCSSRVRKAAAGRFRALQWDQALQPCEAYTHLPQAVLLAGVCAGT